MDQQQYMEIRNDSLSAGIDEIPVLEYDKFFDQAIGLLKNDTNKPYST